MSERKTRELHTPSKIKLTNLSFKPGAIGAVSYNQDTDVFEFNP
jgi:hypothetical protein